MTHFARIASLNRWFWLAALCFLWALSSPASLINPLNSLVSRKWPDGHGEGYGWSTNGLVAYTNRDGQVTRYLRDAAGRKIAKTNANLEVTLLGEGHLASMSITSVVSTLNFYHTYDVGWRLQTVASPAGVFNYQFAGNTPLVSAITLPNGAMITNGYDSLLRLTLTALVNHWGHVLDGDIYIPDLLGLRTNIFRNLGLTTNSVSVSYDNIGQLISWNAVEGTNGASRLNEQVEFSFDAADNLHTRTNGALGQTFNVNALNQITSVVRSGKLTVSGVTVAPVTNLTVNGVTASRYGDLTFASPSNTLADGANTFTNVSQNLYGVSTTNTQTLTLPVTVSPAYDSNGNLTSDGLRSFVFDAADRLTNVYVATHWKEEFAYDVFTRKRVVRQYTKTGVAVQMWFNKATKTIESAWPKTGR